LKIRQREDDSDDYNVFKERDYTELKFGIGSVISLSDKLIINESDMESCIEEINNYFDEINL
jgi:hypothetical protein